MPFAYLASSKVVLLVQTWLLFWCHEERETCFKRAGSRPVPDDLRREGICPRSHPETKLCVRGGCAGTQPVIPALWSSLTKREAGTAQPARTHTYTNTQTVTQIHTDREVQGSTLEHAPALDPLALVRDPPGKGPHTRCPFPSSRKQSFSKHFLTHTQTHTQGVGTAGKRDVKASSPAPRRGEKR